MAGSRVGVCVASPAARRSAVAAQAKVCVCPAGLGLWPQGITLDCFANRWRQGKGHSYVCKQAWRFSDDGSVEGQKKAHARSAAMLRRH